MKYLSYVIFSIEKKKLDGNYSGYNYSGNNCPINYVITADELNIFYNVEAFFKSLITQASCEKIFNFDSFLQSIF